MDLNASPVWVCVYKTLPLLIYYCIMYQQYGANEIRRQLRSAENLLKLSLFPLKRMRCQLELCCRYIGSKTNVIAQYDSRAISRPGRAQIDI